MKDVKTVLREEFLYWVSDLSPIWTGRKNTGSCIFGIFLTALLAVTALTFCGLRLIGYYQFAEWLLRKQ
jgi:hypothetical protein